MGDLRREQEAQAVEAAARMRTSGVLEEYRTRAQQALKRANEMTSQTASENKRLEVSRGGNGVLQKCIGLEIITATVPCAP